MTVTHAEVAAMPKAELHLHIEGTLEPELAVAMAARNGVPLRYSDAAALRRAYAFSDLSSFLALYYECMAVLRTASDFADLAGAYLGKARGRRDPRGDVLRPAGSHRARGAAHGSHRRARRELPHRMPPPPVTATRPVPRHHRATSRCRPARWPNG